MNHILIAGHLGTDPEVRFTSNGQKVTTLRVACNSRKGGKEETIWYKVTIWGEHLDKIVSHLKKGSSVITTGELAKPEIFTDREGKPQISLQITAHQVSFSPFGKSGDSRSGDDSQGKFSRSENSFNGHGEPVGSSAFSSQQMSYGQRETADFRDEEIPF